MFVHPSLHGWMHGFVMFCEILTESELENFEEKRGNKIEERLVTRKRLWRELGLEKTPVNKILNTTLKTQLKKIVFHTFGVSLVDIFESSASCYDNICIVE